MSDRFQLGVSGSWVSRKLNRPKKETGSAQGPGDLALTLGYESIPEWGYSEWKPKGISFLQIKLPTGTSVYQSDSGRSSEITGVGIYTLGVGTVLIKRWSHWDVFSLPAIYWGLPRNFYKSGERLSLKSGLGAALTLGVGFSPQAGDYRIGLKVQPTYQSPKTTLTELGSAKAPAQWLWDTGLDFTYLANADWSLQLSYNDQTLLGPAKNSTLSRTAGLAVSRAWLR